MLGYHGCSRELAAKVVNQEVSLAPSDTKFDWVGPGMYFWESDPLRAWEWAEQRSHENEEYGDPGVVGAIIDLRHCLDLLNRIDQDLVSNAYESLADLYKKARRKLPQNLNAAKGGDKDRRARALDCEVIKHLHSIMDFRLDEAEVGNEGASSIPFYDTVRAMFTEGEPLYDGAAFYRQSHIQIAVRNPECIKGVFFPPELASRQNAPTRF